MTAWICRTCAVEHPESDAPPAACAICSDERQYVPPSGQRWTTLAELRAEGHRGRLHDLEPGLTAIAVEPELGIGQHAVLVRTAAGNVLWDPVGYLDDDLVAEVRALGGLAGVAASHPHMFGVQVAWSRAFDDAPVWVVAADAAWVQRPDPVVRLVEESAELVPGVRLVRIGGHFPGSAVLHLPGADGRGVLLTGDTVAATPGEQWVAFLRSYPNKIPLSAAVVDRVADRVLALDFDRLYDNFGGRVRRDARTWVRRSADRAIAWTRGDFDHLTGTC